MTVNYQIVLQRLRSPKDNPRNNWTFEKVQQQELSRLSGEPELTLRNESEFDRHTYSAIIWNETPKLTEIECEAEWVVYLRETANQDIDEKRMLGYGSVESQLDMLYWDMVNQTTTWVTRITNVKEDNPKI